MSTAESQPQAPPPSRKRRPAGARRRGAWYSLSETSVDEFEPPPSKASPPYLLYDLAYATVAFAAVRWLTGSSLLPPVSLLRPGELLRSCGGALAAAAAVFTACRALPEVSHRKLLEAETTLLKTVEGDVRHHWSRFSTKHASWHVHSLMLRSAAHAAEDAAADAAAAAPSSSTPPKRPVLVIIHGHSAGAAHWEAVLDRMAAVADVHVLDLPGWGRSPCPPQLEGCTSPSRCVELVTEMVKGWLDANRLRSVVLLGHSLGGYYAVQTAHRYPEAVRQLLLVAPAGLSPMMPDGAAAWGIYFKWMPPQRIARVFGRLGYLVFKTIYSAFTKEDLRFPDYYYQLAAATAYTGKADRHNSHFLRLTLAPVVGLYWSHPALSLLMSLDMPVSVIWGQRDEMLPPVLGAMLHRIRPHTDLYYVSGALHNPAHNNPAAFCDAVADAVLKYSGRPRTTLQPPPLALAPADATGEAVASLSPQEQPTPASASLSPQLSPSSAPGSPVPQVHDNRWRETGASALLNDPLAHCDGTADALLAEGAQPNSFGVARASDAVEAAECRAGAAAAAAAQPPPPPSAPLGSLLQRQAAHLRPSPSFGSFVSDASASQPAAAAAAVPPASLPSSTPSNASVHGWRNDWALPRAAVAAAAAAAAALASPLSSPARSSSATSAAGREGVGASGAGAPPSPQHHDGVVAPVGRGRGYCHSCFHAPVLFKAYWRCACGAWTFNAHLRSGPTTEHFNLMLAFLDELYVTGTFNARTSRTIARRLVTRTPLPRPHPPAATAAMQQLLAIQEEEDGDVAPDTPAATGGGENAAPPPPQKSPARPAAAGTGSAGSRHASDSDDVTDGGGGGGGGGAPAASVASSGGDGSSVLSAAGQGQGLSRSASSGSLPPQQLPSPLPAAGLPFPPAPGTLARGEAFLVC